MLPEFPEYSLKLSLLRPLVNKESLSRRKTLFPFARIRNVWGKFNFVTAENKMFLNCLRNVLLPQQSFPHASVQFFYACPPFMNSAYWTTSGGTVVIARAVV